MLDQEVDHSAAIVPNGPVDAEALLERLGGPLEQRLHLGRKLRRADGHVPRNAGSVSWHRTDRQAAAHGAHPVAHVREPGSVLGLALRETGPIVPDLEVKLLVLPEAH